MGWLDQFCRHLRGLSWVPIGIALVAVFVLGTIGRVEKHLAATDPENPHSKTTIAFFVLQSLGLDWRRCLRADWRELEAARVLAVTVFFGGYPPRN